MKDLLKELCIKPDGTTKSILRRQLGNLQHKEGGTQPPKTVADSLIMSLLSSTFLRPQKTGNEEGQQGYTSQGHKNEPFLLEQFFRDPTCPLKLQSISQVGLVS